MEEFDSLVRVACFQKKVESLQKPSHRILSDDGAREAAGVARSFKQWHFQRDAKQQQQKDG